MPDFYTNPRPSWDAVMKPLSESGLWPFIRRAATMVLTHRLHEMGDYDSGISSSDINHTVFGTAQIAYANPATPPGDSSYPQKVLTLLMDELEGYGA